MHIFSIYHRYQNFCWAPTIWQRPKTNYHEVPKDKGVTFSSPIDVRNYVTTGDGPHFVEYAEKEHVLVCVHMVIEGRPGIMLADPGYHLARLVMVMQDKVYPHTGTYLNPLITLVQKCWCCLTRLYYHQSWLTYLVNWSGADLSDSPDVPKTCLRSLEFHLLSLQLDSNAFKANKI